MKRRVLGGDFIHSAPDHVPAIWGRGEDVLWPEGEAMMLTGPTGVGKTSLGGQVIAGRMGLISSVLGFPVEPGKRVLYLAMDRPRQIQRALARFFRKFPQDVVNERLVIEQGPPLKDIGRHPEALIELAEDTEADTVVIDSLKDAATGLVDDQVGQSVSRAMNLCVSNGIEVMVFHHQRKSGSATGGKPNDINSVYGSTLIPASCGSVVLLWGEAGDTTVELSHLKPSVAKVGPLVVTHDHAAGTSSTPVKVDLLDLLRVPMTNREVAEVLYPGVELEKKHLQSSQRDIDRLVIAGSVTKLPRPDKAPRTQAIQFQTSTSPLLLNSFLKSFPEASEPSASQKLNGASSARH
ncbi:MAG: AAA family ATPase [Pseudonocardia sp.]|nr:AAA family ATPase [Pseudonocardia sp.]